MKTIVLLLLIIINLEDETPGKYRYVLGSTGMLWAVPVYFWNQYALSSTSTFWAVPVWSRQYRYTLGSTGTAHSIPVLLRAYQSQNQTSTAQSIPVLSRAYRYCPGVSSSRHHHQADTLSILDVLAKTPCLYLIPELRYPCHYYRHRCRCPLPRRHPSHLRHHHHHHLGSWGNTKRKSSRKPHVSI